MHDPPDRTKQTNIRADGANRTEERNVRFQIFKFTVHGDTHSTRRPFHYGFRRMAIGTMQAHKLFEPAVKYLFRTSQIIPFPLTLLIEAREFDSRPEFIFKRFGFARRCVKNTGPLDNNGPGCD
ncbi:Uncharacterised protein [Shigella sonnei]|nr:Uncharacterised protein [Shigella sonnei]CSE69266.1 Uncharacterised protein [Shigella sonnei]CSF07865.1 Uncharacterised protein [Shigella sonnei]